MCDNFEWFNSHLGLRSIKQRAETVAALFGATQMFAANAYLLLILPLSGTILLW